MARKTALAVTLMLAAALSLSACGRKGQLDSPSTAAEKAEEANAPASESTPTPTPTPAPAPAP
jgi:predicted small lipoprotein YifL